MNKTKINKAQKQISNWISTATPQEIDTAYNHFKEKHSKNNPELLYHLLTPIAESGHLQAKKEVAIRAFNGEGLDTPDYKTAHKNFKEIEAETHSPEVQFALGVISQNGLINEPNFGKAKAWYTKAKNQGLVVHVEAGFEEGTKILAINQKTHQQEEQDQQTPDIMFELMRDKKVTTRLS